MCRRAIQEHSKIFGSTTHRLCNFEINSEINQPRNGGSTFSDQPRNADGGFTFLDQPRNADGGFTF
jgi:hypothetical protein